MTRVGKRDSHTVGLIKPMGFFPMASRASLIAYKILANAGDDADVPNTSSNCPSTATT